MKRVPLVVRFLALRWRAKVAVVLLVEAGLFVAGGLAGLGPDWFATLVQVPAVVAIITAPIAAICVPLLGEHHVAVDGEAVMWGQIATGNTGYDWRVLKAARRRNPQVSEVASGSCRRQSDAVKAIEKLMADSTPGDPKFRSVWLS